ncbi:MAG: NAD-dependent epimerase/dehydratase family protein [Bacteroidota bacterium]|nr:NAD-dependent epimerase/dehydratase family protein [Bacteroidota bacterium]
MILITGATGLLGSHLIKELYKKGTPAKALYRASIPAELKEYAQWIQGDILDPVSLDEAMQGIQQVYHCAASVSFNPKKKQETHKINIEGTANVVNACINNNIQKLLFVSSVAALGRTADGKKITEKIQWSEESNNSEYGKSKYFAEMEVWRGIGEGLNTVIINPSIILGAGDWEKGSTEIFKSVYNEFPWYTEGVNGFVDVKDVVKAMILLMNGAANSERFIISNENISYQQLFNLIAGSFGKKQPHKRVSPFLAEIVWRVEGLKGKISGKDPLLTKETARTAQEKTYFDNSKFLYYAPNFEYTPIQESVTRICKELKTKYQLS